MSSFPQPSPTDAELLRRYQAEPDETGFRRLAERYLPLIHTTARRLVNGDAALAEDVSQMVLADFVRKAAALPAGTVAAGWLHRHTCFTARKLVRGEVRRRAREQKAAQFHIDNTMDAPTESSWPEAAPHLDAALDQLPRVDREALLLRYWQAQDHRSIGAALGSSEEAARKRIARALEKLRTVLKRRGVLLTTALLGQFLTDHATAAVPEGLAATLPGMAWRQSSAGGPAAAGPGMLWKWSGAAALLIGGGWWAARAGWFREKRVSPAATGQLVRTAQDTGNPLPGTVLHFLLADVPAAQVGARLLNRQPGEEDESLLQAVRRMTGSGGKFLEMHLSCQDGKQQNWEVEHPHEYATAWAWDEKTDRPVPRDPETYRMGTSLTVTASLSGGKSVNLTWALRHYHSEPEFHAWPVSLTNPDADPERVVRMEDLHSGNGRGRATDLALNESRLLMAEYLASATLPDLHPEPRTLLLFVTPVSP